MISADKTRGSAIRVRESEKGVREKDDILHAELYTEARGLNWTADLSVSFWAHRNALQLATTRMQ